MQKALYISDKTIINLNEWLDQNWKVKIISHQMVSSGSYGLEGGWLVILENELHTLKKPNE